MKKMIIIAVVAIIVVGGIAFYGGMKYGENKKPATASFSGNFQNFRGSNGSSGGQRGNFGNGGGALSGQVLSVNPQGFTLQMRDGSSRIVFVATSTAVMKSATGSSSDIANGEEVTVVGSQNSDGSFSAQSVQIRPAMPNQPNR